MGQNVNQAIAQIILFCPSRLLSKGNSLGVKLTTHLVLEVRIPGTTAQVAYISSWSGASLIKKMHTFVPFAASRHDNATYSAFNEIGTMLEWVYSIMKSSKRHFLRYIKNALRPAYSFVSLNSLRDNISKKVEFHQKF